MKDNLLLQVNELRVKVGQAKNKVHAVRGVFLAVQHGSRLGIVGESGSGKSMTAMALLRLLPPTGVITGGTIYYNGRNLLQLSESEMQRVRGKEISMVFQNAASALNPLFPVGQQIADIYRHHRGGSAKTAWKKAVAMLDAMGIPDPERRARAYPHQYSGGMAQRAMIAMALVCSPRLLIADEPTTGLDLTIQAQVLDLIKEQISRSGASLLLISHDIAVVSETCTDVAVMYAGEVLEAGALEDVFGAPASPYTKALLECFEAGTVERLPYITGRVPDLHREILGCSFAPRCSLAQAVCQQERPGLREVAKGHLVACHFA